MYTDILGFCQHTDTVMKLARSFEASMRVLPYEFYSCGEFQCNRRGLVQKKHQNALIFADMRHGCTTLESFIVLASSIRQHPDSRLDALLPYMPYSRDTLSCEAIVQCLFQAGIANIYTLDIHQNTKGVTNISLAELYASYVPSVPVVSPDLGGEERASLLSLQVGNTGVVVGRKVRSDGNVDVRFEETTIPPEVIMYDDILDSGATFRACLKALHEKGVQKVHACITHRFAKLPRRYRTVEIIDVNAIISNEKLFSFVANQIRASRTLHLQTPKVPSGTAPGEIARPIA